MAEDLRFGITFDVQSAAEKAKADLPSLIKDLQTMLNSKPLAINLDLDKDYNKTFFDTGSIDEIDKRVKDLAKAWNQLTEEQRIYNRTSGEYTEVAKEIIAEYTRLTGARRSYAQTLKEIEQAAKRGAKAEEQLVEKQRRTSAMLSAEENSISAVTAKLKYYEEQLKKAAVGSTSFEMSAAQVKRLRDRLTELQAASDKATGKMAKAEKQAKAMSTAYHEQTTYVQRLIQRLMVYASFSMLRNFADNIREVTAQFELQRISLGAIIQDQERANMLFAEIQGFAMRSPLKILDLTKYTKQLAAYQIGIDDLFSTTKRLADVSVGLGVSMDRLILAYGQIKATGYLRASEVRQLTEAGLPIVDMLAKKISAANGELVRTKDIMAMISKREIPFEMVAEVFEDMTNKGGIFYNMQEKQGNTLYGLWQKLGDAADIMYSEIGNTGFVNNSLKDAISFTRTLMVNWKATGTALLGLIAILGSYAMYLQKLKLQSAMNSAANQKYIASLRVKIATLQAEKAAMGEATAMQRQKMNMTIAAAQAELKAATSTNVLTRAFNGMKAAFLTNPFGVVIGALMLLASVIVPMLNSKLGELRGKLADINADYSNRSMRMKNNFEELATAVVENIDGSKKQKDALDELQRTYGDIIGIENVQIEKLREMKGDYRALLDMIDEYNAKAAGDAREAEIKTTYDGIIENARKNMTNKLKSAGLNDQEIASVMQDYLYYIQQGIDKTEALQKAMQNVGKESNPMLEAFRALGRVYMAEFQPGTLLDSKNQAGLKVVWSGLTEWGEDAMDYADAIQAQNDALAENRKRTIEAANAFGEYAKGLDKVSQGLQNIDWSSPAAMQSSQKEYNATSKNTGEINVPISVVYDPSKSEGAYQQMLEESNAKIEYIFNSMKEQLAEKGIDIPTTFYKAAKSVRDGNKQFSFVDFDAIKALTKDPKALAAIREYQNYYEQFVPSDKTAYAFKLKLAQLAEASKVSFDLVAKYALQSGGDVQEHVKNIKSQIEALTKSIIKMQKVNSVLSMFGLPGFGKDTIEEEQSKKKVLEEYLKFLDGLDKSKSTGKGSKKQDPRLAVLQEEASLVERIYKEYKELEKTVGSLQAAKDVKQMFGKTLEALGKRHNFGIATTINQLVGQLDILYDKMAAFPNLDKTLKEFRFKIEKLNIDNAQKEIERQIKELAEKIKQSKAAQDFYNEIFKLTGNATLSQQLSVNIYGTDGSGIFEQTKKQLEKLFTNQQGKSIDISSAIDTENMRIRYSELMRLYEQYKGAIIEGNREMLKDAIQKGRETSQKQILEWEKSLAKAKDYEQRRADVINEYARQREEIIRNTDLPDDEKNSLVSQSRKKEAEELSKLSYEELTSSERYVNAFKNLATQTEGSLKRLKTLIQQVIATNKDLSPANLKALVDALNNIDNEINGRGIAGNLLGDLQALFDAPKRIRKAKDELKQAQAEYDAAKPRLDSNISKSEAKLSKANAEVLAAEKEKLAISERLAQLKKEGNANTQEYTNLQMQEFALDQRLTAAEDKQNRAQQGLALAKEDERKAANKVAVAEGKVTDEQNKQRKGLEGLSDDFGKIGQFASNLASELENVKDLLGISSESAAGIVFDSAIKSLQQIQQLMTILQVAMIIYNAICASNPWLAIATAVLAVATFMGNFFSAKKVAKANKEIEQQQELLDKLQYTYDRLDKAKEKAFGSDYIKDYNEQIKNLQAQQSAYLKQAEAERSKGKKADQDKIDDYLEKARDAADEIKDMQSELSEFFTGTDLTSAAKDFASAWLDAYLTYSNTADAIREKFQDMMKNMVINSVMAKMIQAQLKPFFDEIDTLASDGNLAAEDIARIMSEIPSQVDAIDKGLQLAADNLEAAGVSFSSMRENGDFTGISRDIANASEESINGLAAGINTQNYYISHVPQIADNVAAIRVALESGASPMGGSVGDLITLQNQAMGHLQGIERYTAEGVAECRRIAASCEEQVSQLRKVIVAKGGKTSHGVSVYLQN